MEFLIALFENSGYFLIPTLCVMAVAQQFAIHYQGKRIENEKARAEAYYHAYINELHSVRAYENEFATDEEDKEEDGDPIDYLFSEEDEENGDPFDDTEAWEFGGPIFESPEEEAEFNALQARYRAWQIANGKVDTETNRGFPRLVGNVLEIDENTQPITIKLVRPIDDRDDIEDYDN
ncbi:hypothetical protein O152_gp031 [Pseudomonas phage PaBG]|uniref:Uncharacterized protein n=1 Tax=Pseudomonas phage PaBG TaxID=1335230 RepID=S5VZE9_9CAUD|nr:hypothetical protein O152_gp031 [Pseudomonas phage PaBG]AGS81915.1 hypothetical protein PaBG_00031 [Pseudomonas phage PaBG]